MPPPRRMIAAGAASMGRATTPTPGAQSRWPRAVARLRLALRSPATARGSSGHWMGCFRPVPALVLAPSSSAVVVAVMDARGKRPEVEMEPARGEGEDVWTAQAEAEVAQGGGFPVLFDISLIDKTDLFTGTFMPSTDLTGGYRVLSYVDPAEPNHAPLKTLLFHLLSNRRQHVIPAFRDVYGGLFDLMENDLARAGKADFGHHNNANAILERLT